MIPAIKLLIISILLTISITGVGQNVFETTYSTNSDDAPAGAAVLSNGYVVGVNHSVHPEQSPIHKAMLLTFDNAGVIQDSAELSFTDARVWIADILVENNEPIAVANCLDTVTADFNVILYRFSSSLDLLQTTVIGGPSNNEHASSALTAANGNLLLAGTFVNNGLPDSLFLFELSNNTWTIENQLSIGQVAAFNACIVDNSAVNKYTLLADNAIVSINSTSFELDTAHLVNGNFVSLSYGKAISNSTYLRLDGSVRDGSSMINPSDWELTAYEVSATTATHLDTLHCGFNNHSDFPAAKGLDFQTPDSLFFAGMKDHHLPTQSLFQNANWGIELWCTNATGNVHWSAEFGGNALYWVHQVIATDDGGALVVSSKWDWVNNPTEERDLYLMKVDAQGNFASSIANQSYLASGAIIYPNPTSATATLKLESNNKALVSIYNIYGQQVDNFTIVGTADIDFSSYKVGNYFIRVNDGTSIETLKIVVTKD